MGGDVTVNSVPGVGSTFTIKVPATVIQHESSATHEAAPAETQIAVVQGLHVDTEPVPHAMDTILVIDDDATQRDLMCRFLTSEGFCVQTASEGEEGLRLARRLLPIAITLDVMMPGMDGWTVLSALKADPNGVQHPRDDADDDG